MFNESIHKTMLFYNYIKKLNKIKNFKLSINKLYTRLWNNFNFFSKKINIFSISPFLIDKNDDKLLNEICNKMTLIIEKVVDAYINNDKKIDNFFVERDKEEEE